MTPSVEVCMRAPLAAARFAAVFVLAFLLPSWLLFAQQDIGQPTTSGDASADGFKALQEPHYLTGTVTMEDGSPPPALVVIEAVCNGTARQLATTDSKGRF